MCGKHDSEVGPITWRGKCATCWPKLERDNAYSLQAHSGPEFQRWRRALASSVGGVLLDDLHEAS